MASAQNQELVYLRVHTTSTRSPQVASPLDGNMRMRDCEDDQHQSLSDPTVLHTLLSYGNRLGGTLVLPARLARDHGRSCTVLRMGAPCCARACRFWAVGRAEHGKTRCGPRTRVVDGKDAALDDRWGPRCRSGVGSDKARGEHHRETSQGQGCVARCESHSKSPLVPSTLNEQNVCTVGTCTTVS